MRQVGTVKEFDRVKGWGFISAEYGGDIFFHKTNIPIEGFRTFDAGTPVEFSARRDGRGRRCATNVRPLQWTAGAVAKFLSSPVEVAPGVTPEYFA